MVRHQPPYGAIVRLCGIAAERWGDITATHLSSGSLLRMPLWKFIAVVYSWCVERVPQDKLEEWLVELNDLLPWQDVDSEAAAELESASFFGMQSKG